MIDCSLGRRPSHIRCRPGRRHARRHQHPAAGCAGRCEAKRRTHDLAGRRGWPRRDQLTQGQARHRAREGHGPPPVSSQQRNIGNEPEPRKAPTQTPTATKQNYPKTTRAPATAFICGLSLYISRPPCPAAFRQQMVELVRSGRTPGDLAREFEPSAEAIRDGVAQLIATRASAPTACAPKNMRRFVGCAGRTGGCAKNAKFWQTRRRVYPFLSRQKLGDHVSWRSIRGERSLAYWWLDPTRPGGCASGFAVSTRCGPGE